MVQKQLPYPSLPRRVDGEEHDQSVTSSVVATWHDQPERRTAESWTSLQRRKTAYQGGEQTRQTESGGDAMHQPISGPHCIEPSRVVQVRESLFARLSDTMPPAASPEPTAPGTDMILLILEQVRTLLHAEGVSLTSFNRTGNKTVASKGCKACPGLQRMHLHNAEDILTRADFPVAPGHIACVSLAIQGTTMGTLCVCRHCAIQEDDLRVLSALGNIAANAIFDNHQATQEQQRTYDSTLEGWVRALELRDNETEEHTRRVTVMTVELARALGMGEDDLVHVRRGALLHDIGKIAIPDSILLKPGPLTDEEWCIMREHPRYAYDLLAPIHFLQLALVIPYSHHEKWDGTGYPHGLQGEEIPLAARIFAVVDVWDALRFDRPYRKGWSETRVREHIKSLAGQHFDPQVVEVFLRFLEEKPHIFSCNAMAEDQQQKSSYRPDTEYRCLI